MAKIMVVDDSPDIVWVYSAILKKGGYDVISASSGEEALELLETEKPEVILLDIMMPGMNGWETCQKIKENEKTKDIIVIMVSVKSEADDIRKSLDFAGADGHIDKLRSSDIVDVVGNALKGEIGGAHEIF